MKTPLWIMAMSTALAGIAAGCKPSAPTSAVAAGTAALVPEFSAKSGLYLPDTTRRSLGLEIVDVAEQKISGTLPLTLRVYHAGANSILASTTVTPEQAQLLKPGHRIAAQFSDGKTVATTVQRVSEQLKHVTGLVELLVEIPDATEDIAVGDFISATAGLDSEKSVVTIPRRALLENTEGQFAYTVSGEHLVRTAIKTGVSNSDFVEVTDGLYAGDQVVSHPVMSLWLTELASVKGGQACCVAPPKGK